MNAEQKVIANNRFSNKLSWKRSINLDLTRSIENKFKEIGLPIPPEIEFKDYCPKISDERSLDITREAREVNLLEDQDHLNRYRRYKSRRGDKAKSLFDYTNDQYRKIEQSIKTLELKKLKAEIDSNELKCFVDKETGELLSDPKTGEFYHEKYRETLKLYYTLRKSNKSCYAVFQEGKKYRQQHLASFYSKHRLDEVWNWRKSQLIRKIWRDYLLETKIYEDFKPMHLMLTVPHTAEGWNGKQFYGAELIEKFNFMRKHPEWKKMIYGGEYGMEVTRKGKNGLHIHLHCLVFQRKGYTVDEVWKWIADHWYNLTSAEITHYEPLYIHIKDSKTNQYIRNDNRVYRLNPRTNQKYLDQEIGSKKKYYLDDSDPWYRSLKGEDKLKSYVNGVMECIKYHFKSDNFKTQDGDWDIDLIAHVLNNSKSMRFYSKFGGFYTEKRLNYSRIESGEEGITTTDLLDDDQDINGNAQAAIDGLINPFTNKPAQLHEYVKVLATPETIKHKSKSERYEPIVDPLDHNYFYAIQHHKGIKETMKDIGRNAYRDLLEGKDYGRFIRDVQTV